ncbi:hypothetical protein BA6E_10622 [Bacteroidales bacterium 6E]|jgi:hypothetical protein|nr:hypothetical protein BA6E_10622 [Bacteroidales bacterium 6E]
MHLPSCLTEGNVGIKLIENSGLNIYFFPFFDITQAATPEIDVKYPFFLQHMQNRN